MADLTAAVVVDHARDQHAELSEVNVPRKLLFRELTRGISDLFDEIFPRVPEFLADTVEVAIGDIDFSTDAAIDLSTAIPDGWKDLTQLSWAWAVAPVPGGSIPVVSTFVPWQQRSRPTKLPAHTFRKNVLYILGPGNLYNQFGTAILTYTPQPPDITAPTDVVPLTFDAREPLAFRLAYFGVRRLVNKPKYAVTEEDVAELKAQWIDAKTGFLQRIFRLTQRQSARMRDVTLDPGGPWIP